MFEIAGDKIGIFYTHTYLIKYNIILIREDFMFNLCRFSIDTNHQEV